MTEVSKSWHWNRMSARRPSQKLDENVTLRGSIAHRGSGASAVREHQVDDYYDHVKRLVERTDAQISQVVEDATGRTPW